MNKQNLHNVYSISIIIDEFSDDPSFSRHSKLLHSWYTRGRHSSLSTIASTQKFAAVGQVIRVNATFVCVYRLRNNQDLACFLYEVFGSVGRAELVEIQNLATKEPYSFVSISLGSPTINEMCYINSNQKMQLSD